MAGCYGSSAEDRARERELYHYLDSQTDDTEEVERRVADLWDTLGSSQLAAEKMALDWEILANIEWIILNTLAYAIKNNDPTHLMNIMKSFVGMKLESIARHEMEASND